VTIEVKALAGEAAIAALTAATPAQLVDLARFDEVTGGERAFSRDLIDAFVTSCADIEREMQVALTTSDRKQLERAAHKLKGAAANIYAPLLRLHAEELETCASTMDALQLDIHLAQMSLYMRQSAAYLKAARAGDTNDSVRSA
jgi:HPt (histidine-containing phosphotransfer) domain-containing protein